MAYGRQAVLCIIHCRWSFDAFARILGRVGIQNHSGCCQQVKENILKKEQYPDANSILIQIGIQFLDTNQESLKTINT